MNIRLIAFDLDGTLLDDGKRLPDRNRQALAECARRGIYIVPCTGRFVKGIPLEILDTGVRYAITMNGGSIEDVKTGEILDRRPLEKTDALAVMRMAREYPGVMYDAFVGGQGISEEKFYDHLERFGATGAVRELIRNTRIKIADIISYVEQTPLAVDKVNLLFADMGDRAVLRERLAVFPGLLVTSSLANNLEINGIGAEKGDALLRLAAYLGIAREETMAFGDGGNDYSLIEKAGVGIAMSNGESGLKAKADYVAPDNNSAGVAQVIEKFLRDGSLKEEK